jgi:hypothetical protein
MIQLNNRLYLPFLTIGISVTNFLFILYVTNFFGLNSRLDINLLIYGVVLFVGGQLGTLLSNSYIPYIRKDLLISGNKGNEDSFLYGYALLTLAIAFFLFFTLLIFLPGEANLKLFYSFFLVFLTINQLISIRILEKYESYVKVQVINFFVSALALIVFHFLNYLDFVSISLSLCTAHIIGALIFFFNDNHNSSFKLSASYKYLMVFTTFFKKHIKVILCLSIFGLASVLDVFFVKFLSEGDFSLHSLSFRIIVAATSVYYASFGIIFTNDITKPGITSKQTNKILRNVFTTILVISLFFNILFYILMDHPFLWRFILNISESNLTYFSTSLFYNSLLIFPMLITSYYFRYKIALNQINFLLFLLVIWILIYIFSVLLFQMYETKFLLQFSLNISWWVCVIFITIKEYRKGVSSKIPI